jgi:hypothetical protein
MIQFFLGFVAGAVARSDRRQVGRALAGIAVKTENAASYLKTQVRRLSAGVVEDYEDLVAEARAKSEVGGDQSST